MPNYTIPRTGQRPLEFTGQCLATTDSRTADGLANARWWELALYATADGRHLAAAAYRTQWDTELPQDRVEITPDLASAFDWLEAINPLEPVRGYPDSPHYQAKNAHLQQTLRGHYAQAVTRLANALGVTERL